MEESFVVLPSAAASMYRPGDNAPPPAGGGPPLPAPDGGHGSLDSRIVALTRVFEIASRQTLVEHPLCLECMRALLTELDSEAREAEADVAAYEACLARVQSEARSALSAEDFAREQREAEREERELEERLEQVEAERALVRSQAEAVEAQAAELDEQELQYWHEWNDFQLQLRVHQEERDAVLAKIEVATAQLEALKGASVLSEAFHIAHDGEFGTVNGFRLGRLPSVPVDWDEINAAWGQACLLLFTMAQTCHTNFSYRILPMGSYPRITDGKNTYDLFGPVNLFWSTRYDKAMVLYLTCLKEFADFAAAKDQAAGLEKAFQLPYKIQGDKVNGWTVKQSFNPGERWTKALRYMLADLKWALVWLIRNATPQPPPPLPTPSAAPRPATGGSPGGAGAPGSSLSSKDHGGTGPVAEG